MTKLLLASTIALAITLFALGTGDVSAGGAELGADGLGTADAVATAGKGRRCRPALRLFRAKGCRRLFMDSGAASNPARLWGRIDCASNSRHSQQLGGGDRSRMANGRPQRNGLFRRLTVFDGDDRWGERCELGLNNRPQGPTAVYRPGKERFTFASIRLPGAWPLQNPRWQVAMQIKQAGPADASGGVPAIELQARRGRWFLMSFGREIWQRRATQGVWTRFAIKTRMSARRMRGRIRIYADLNGDGDARDRRERSRAIRRATLKRESPGSAEDGLRGGQPIPSHLRMGIYHDPAVRCSGGGCAIEIDNVQIHGR